MTTRTTLFRSLVFTPALLASATVMAQDNAAAGWYVKPTLTLSQLGDQDGSTSGIGQTNGLASVSLDAGFAAGLGLGYRYNERWAAELAWEYRSNASEVRLADGQRFADGNYASNSFFVNGRYHFPASGAWQPYIGLGLGWLQEIDIDLETAGTELSYAGDGDTGYQAFAGVDFDISPRWSWQLELRYSSFGDIELSGENNSGRWQGLGYDPLSLQLGLSFKF